jgi:hypothetical protein
MSKLGITLALAVTLPPLARGAETQVATLDLGGPRRVKAELAITEDDYIIAVRLLAVRSFDSSTNARLNREKARRFALLALARHLTGSKTGNHEMTVSGVVVDGSGLRAKTYWLTLKVPITNVRLETTAATNPASDEVPPEDGTEHLPAAKGLLTRRQDYLDTLQDLLVAYSDRLKASLAKIGEAAPGEVFYVEVADIEEAGIESLEQLQADGKADKLLLTIEQEELEKAIEKQKEALLELLRAAVQGVEENPKGEDAP